MSAISRTVSDFGTRSLLTHALMALGFVGAVVSGLFIEGQVGLIAMVAFINFTAGMWICQSIHALGNASSETEYTGVLGEVRSRVQ